jgi:peptidoglycan/LPS O-acetylase OafA/YrhL
METGGLYLQLSVGWGTENFFGGFPRVFYGFTCGMLLYQLRSLPSPFRLLNWIQRAPSFHTFILYAGFVGMLLNPHLMKGLYSFGVIIVLAPLLIMQGSNAKCENRAVLATSEFLGWLSYPIYCLHFPVLFGMRVIDKHVGFSTKYGVSCEMMAIMGTIFLATVSAFLFDRLKVQRNLADFLRRIFEDGWCRRARLSN